MLNIYDCHHVIGIRIVYRNTCAQSEDNWNISIDIGINKKNQPWLLKKKYYVMIDVNEQIRCQM